MTTALIQLTIFVTVLLLVVAYSVIQQRRWREKWPPISDDEFMARCKPGTSRAVALRVRTIVAEQLGVDYERVYPEQELVKDLGCD